MSGWIIAFLVIQGLRVIAAALLDGTPTKVSFTSHFLNAAFLVFLLYMGGVFTA